MDDRVIGDVLILELTAAAAWTPCQNFSGAAFAGVAVGGELRVETSGGHKISSENYNPAPIVGLKATFRF